MLSNDVIMPTGDPIWVCPFCGKYYYLNNQAKCDCPNWKKSEGNFQPIPLPEYVILPPAKTCTVCGGVLVTIRGKYPHSDKRTVCPICLADKMDMIREIVSEDYGKAMEDKLTGYE